MSKAADDYVTRSVRYSEGGYRGGGGEYGSGWILFAGLMLGFAGVMNTIDGILAIGRSKVFVDDAAYVFSDLRTWGWIILFLGVWRPSISPPEASSPGGPGSARPG
jgi:hypothetical protein